jgi:4-amino-4-deoxy-L-arabinose transferase-like glycosyltransferase
MAMISTRAYGLFGLGAVIFFVLSFVLFKQVVPPKNHMDIDSGAYVQAANFLLKDGSFARLKQQPYYGLGYPLVLAGLKKLGHESVGFIICIQALLAWFIALLIWRIAALLFNRRAAWIAYFWAVTHVGLLVFAQFLLTEIELMFFLTLFVERLLSFLYTRRLTQLAAAGFALGLSCTIKSVGLLFIGPLVVLLVLMLWRSGAARAVAVLIVACMLPYSAYVLHNKVMFEQSERSSMVKINLYYWYYPHLRAQINGTSVDDERRYLQKEVAFEAINSLLVRDVTAHPARAVGVLIKNWVKTLCGLYTSNIKLLVDEQFVAGSLSFFRLKGCLVDCLWAYITNNTNLLWIKIVGCIEALFLGLRYVLIPFGCLVLVRQRRWWVLTFIILYIGYFIGITGHDGCARFRMMIDMMLLVLAAGGCASLVRWRHSKQ